METFIQYNYCTDDYYNENGKCTVELLSGEKVGLLKRCSKYTKIDECTDSAKLNMTINDYNLMMGMTSNMIGFTLVFLVGFLFVLQGRR